MATQTAPAFLELEGIKGDSQDEEFKDQIEVLSWSLGASNMLGAGVYSVQDKFRIRIYTRNLAQYVRFLPGGDLCEPLADFVYFYIGAQLDWDTELAIPSGAVEPMRLGHFGQLGWTTWMAPDWTTTEEYRRDARFHPAERMERKRRMRQAGSEGDMDGRHQS